MPPQDVILDAQKLIGRLWREKQSPERARILECAGYILSFISAAGLDYRFEDFRQSQNRPSPAEQGTPGTANLRELLARTQGFFNQLLAAPEASNEQGPLRIILDAVDYIASTGELEALREHIRRLGAGAPPRVVAAFGSLGEATAWLERAPEPPSKALVLIDGRYHQAIYLRDLNHRKVIPWPAMEYYLAELVQDVAPVAMASFASHELAEAWLNTQTEPPDRTWVRIAGELHLAVNHANVQCRALYPLSMAAGYAVNDEVEPEPPRQE
jgi:hypothetical protein